MKTMEARLVAAVILIVLAGNVKSDTMVNTIQPRHASMGGAVRVTIHGQDFSERGQLAEPGSKGQGTEIYFVSKIQQFPCNLDTDEVTPNIMICYTSPMPEAHYVLAMSVDGKPMAKSKLCKGNEWHCGLYIISGRTPRIYQMFRYSGPPGSLLRLWGTIFTTDIDSATFGSKPVSFRRVYIGDQVCELKKENSDEKYELVLDSATSSNGKLTCKVKGITIGNRNVSLILTGAYGRSLTHPYVFRESAKGQLYMYQTHAVVDSSSPKMGSTQGGTMIMIQGNYFDPTPGATKVMVGSQSCDITFINDTLIACKTPADPKDTVFGGGRGIVRETWNDTNIPFNNFGKILDLNSSSPGYHIQKFADFGWHEKDCDKCNTRVRAYFVAPRCSNYTFFLAADDNARVTFKTKVDSPTELFNLSCSKYCFGNFHWNKRHRYSYTKKTQVSPRLYLSTGDRLYIDAVHWQSRHYSSMALGVLIHKTNINEHQAEHAHNEKHRITIKTAMNNEKQSVRYVDWTIGTAVKEVQKITMSVSDQNAVSDISYKIGHYGAKTSTLRYGISAVNLQRELNQLASLAPDTVSVSRTDNSGGYEYTVTFNGDRGELALLQVSKGSKSQSLTTQVTKMTTGQGSGRKLYFNIAGVSTPAIPNTATAKQMVTALKATLGPQCLKSITTGDFNTFYWGMEPTETNYHKFGGELFEDEEAFCGQFSYKNPKYLYLIDNGFKLYAVDLSARPYMCLAYKGQVKNEVRMSYSWVPSGAARRTNTDTFPSTFNSDGKWHYQCLNLKDILSARRNDGSGFQLRHIQMFAAGPRSTYYVDAISFRKAQPLEQPEDAVEMRVPAAKPGGSMLKDFKVNKTADNEYVIEMISRNCGYNVPLLQLTNKKWHGQSTAQWKRLKAASKPVGGSLGITYKEVKRTVKVTAKTEKIANELMTIEGMGVIEVTQAGNCSCLMYDIEFVDRPGDQEPPQIDTGALTDFVSSSVETLQDGGFMHDLIPGELLQKVATKPQVTVTVNDIPSEVTGNVLFDFKDSATPTITAISPATGSGTTLTITGTGFSEVGSNSWDKSFVTIGKKNCTITKQADTSIECSVSASGSGQHKVNVTIKGKGKAKGDKMFTYQGMISGISPTSATNNGGAALTVSGKGLASTKSVQVEGQDCWLTSSSGSTVTCTVPRRQTGSSSSNDVEVTLTTGQGTLTSPTKLTYTSPQTVATITSVSPATAKVCGTSKVIITGTNFGQQQGSSSVTVGKKMANVISWSDTQVIMSAPGLDSGIYDLMVNVGTTGFAEFGANVPKNITYTLEVSSVNPTQGSVMGGTDVTITGAGFPGTKTLYNISFGSTKCDVKTTTSTKVTCQIESTSKVHKVTNKGITPGVGKGFRWNKRILQVMEGDIVQWHWSFSPFLKDVAVAFYETSNATSDVAKEKGFSSGDVGTAMGSFQYQFWKAGNFFYASKPVDPNERFIMRGLVIVVARPSTTGELNMTVSGRTPKGKPTCSGPDPVGCTVPKPTSKSPDKCVFTFWECFTPMVTSMTTQSDKTGVSLNIGGKRFDPTSANNVVSIGKAFSCAVNSATSTAIACKVDHNNTMPVNKAFMTMLRVQGSGYAKIAMESKMSFVLQPKILSVSPTTGSLQGGTNVTITGYGFTSSASTTSVSFSTSICQVASVKYTQILCVTSTSSSSQQRKKRATQSTSVVLGRETVGCSGDCSFQYSASATPTVTTITPTTIQGSPTTLTVAGTMFGTDADKVLVSVGESNCQIQSVTDSQIICNVGPVVVGTQNLQTKIVGLGLASIAAAAENVNVVAEVTSMAPTTGSLNGGTVLTFIGGGFHLVSTSVTVDGAPCPLVANSITITSVKCTTPAHAAGQANVVVNSNAISFPSQTFTYSAQATPAISSISPTSGAGEITLTVTGTGFSDVNANNKVLIGGAPCSVSSSTPNAVMCNVPQLPARAHDVTMVVAGKGSATSSAQFTSVLTLTAVSPNQGSLAGGTAVTVTGSGFASDGTTVNICDQQCTLTGTPTGSQAVCLTPSSGGTADRVCDAIVSVQGMSRTLTNGFTYLGSLTPDITSVSPRRGGTGGGTPITIAGTGFGASGNKVKINGVTCDINSESAARITCTTNSSPISVRTKVEVTVPAKGFASMRNADFTYVNEWSNNATWNNGPLPAADDFIVIKDIILLDIDTPVLSMLVIKGGKLMFDDEKPQLKLSARRILIVDGGALEVGTKDKPYQNQATIELFGHARSREMPLYGTKVLAVRNGTLDLHGNPVTSWTLLGSTASAGATSVTLKNPVDWKIGEEFVIATTGDRHSQRETEVRKITGISRDKKTLALDQALVYTHIAETRTFGSTDFEMRAEVGLLTRNIVVRGNVDTQWQDNITACPEGFNTGEFATQTCFSGRFGDQVGSDHMGCHIIISPPTRDSQLAIARIEHTEITHCGQAFRLARYPVHFHLLGNGESSYVRGCSIHKTFNRAINIHGTHNVMVEYNVVYDVMGGAIFLEDGIETCNTFQYNLALFVKSSTSLLNDDITPAAFWVTNPNNTVRHNHAAGGTHFGFWYRMHKHPDGPSYTPTICPQNVPVKEFYNNTVHSQGWFGLWIFEHYHPRVDGACNGEETNAVFSNFYSWNNEKGAEVANGGAIQFKNFFMVNNQKAGVEVKIAKTRKPFLKDGPLVEDSQIIGHTGSADGKSCTNTGIILPYYQGLVVKNVEFVNFDRSNCKAIGVTSVQGLCTTLCGGFQYRFKGIKFSNAANKGGFRWTHDGVFEDEDGSLTGGVSGRKVVPKTGILPQNKCSKLDEFSKGAVEGYVCDSSVRFSRFAFNQIHPPSLKFKNLVIKNQHGTDVSRYTDKRATHKQGWMVVLPTQEPYFMYFENAGHITNMSYVGEYLVQPNDFIIMSTKMSQTPDIVQVYAGKSQNGSKTPLDKSVSKDGDWYFNAEEQVVQYFVSYSSGTVRRKRATASSSKFVAAANLQSKSVKFQALKCPFTDCKAPVSSDNTPPPTERPATAFFWSRSAADWLTNIGIPKPKGDTDVVIPQGKWIVVDVPQLIFRTLNISGTLELEYQNNQQTQKAHDIEIIADFIIISGGRFIIGWPDNQQGQRRFRGKAEIKLRGTRSSPEFQLPAGTRGPPIGSTAIAVFGAFQAMGIPHTVTWTHLSDNVSPNSDSIPLRDAVDWSVGDEIVIGTSSFKTSETEVVKITAISALRKTLTVSPALKYRHTGKQYTVDGVKAKYDLAAEVGLLTRNIKITSANVDVKKSFGARVLVGVLQASSAMTGYARLDNVEFNRAGQEGYTSQYDPRFQLTFLDTGTVSNIKPSMIKSCSFNNGFSPAVGVFNMKQLVLENNVVYHTVGGGLIVAGEQNSILRNLVTKVLWPGTYNGRTELANFNWNGGIEITKASGVTMKNNSVTGSERAGYRIYNRPCPISATSPDPWEGNVARSVLTGVALFNDEAKFGQCMYVHGFAVYKAADYGIYIMGTPSVKIRNYLSVDNSVGVYPVVVGPSAKDHIREDKFIKIERSVFVGRTPDSDCNDKLTDADPNYKFSKHARYPANNRNFGIIMGSFTQSTNNAPKKPWAKFMAYGSLGGQTDINDVVFSNFSSNCQSRDYMIGAPAKNEDLIHSAKTSNITVKNSEKNSYIFISRPNILMINPSDCVDMDCDGLKKVVIEDDDGSLLGSKGSATSQAEFEWGGDVRRGLNDDRIPSAMLTDASGNRLNVTEIAPNKGIVRNSQCTYIKTWNGYECHNIDYQMLLIESMDSDTETRRLSPVAVYNPANKYVDLINGPQDHGWCSGYTCQKRLSTFSAIVASNMEFLIYFTGTNPQKLRLHLLSSGSDALPVLLGIYYSTPQRLDVYVNKRLVLPKNAFKNSKGRTVYKTPTSPDQFKPQLTDESGANWFITARNMMYITIKGPVPIDIFTSPMVIIDLTMPPMTTAEFFNGEKIIFSMAKFLGISADRIKITNIVRAKSKRRKRATSGNILGVEVSISSSPQPILNQTSTAAMEKTRTDMLNISQTIVSEVQTGNLGNKINMTISSTKIQEPVPTTNSTAWQDRVKQTPSKLVILIPNKIKLAQTGKVVSEGAPFSEPIAIEMLDASNTRVVLLGSSTNPWKMTATLRKGQGSDPRATILGDATVGFRMGWANFSTLSISHSGSGYMIDIAGTYPDASKKYTATVGPFNISAKSLKANFSSQPTLIAKNASFAINVTIIDPATGARVSDLSWKNHTWTCTLSIEGSNGYTGKLYSDNCSVQNNGTIMIKKLSLSSVGQAFVKVRVQSNPKGFDLSAMSEAINVEPAARFKWQTLYKQLMKIRFKKDFSKLTATKKRRLKALLKNKLANKYQDISFTDFALKNGSIMAEFNMAAGQKNTLESTSNQVSTDLKSGTFAVTLDGEKMTADKTVWVNGQQQNETGSTTTTKSEGLSKGVIAAIVICVVIVIIILLAIAGYFLCCKTEKKVENEKWAQAPSKSNTKGGSSSSLRSSAKIHPKTP